MQKRTLHEVHLPHELMCDLTIGGRYIIEVPATYMDCLSDRSFQYAMPMLQT